MNITFNVRSVSDASVHPIEVNPQRVILGGYSARSAEVRQRHIDELRLIGIEPPAQVPAFWHVSNWLLTTGSEIQVQGERTSGEAEFALIRHGGETYVAVASDQTDREFETHSIPRSKQLCPKILSSDVLPLTELVERWDEVVIASEVSDDGETWLPYQRSELAAMMDPQALIEAASGRDALEDGNVLLSGTIPLIDGVTRHLSHFRAILTVPDSTTELRLAYRVDVLPEIVTRAVVDA